MTDDELCWREALAIHEAHGAETASWLDGQISTLVAEGDEMGLAALFRMTLKLEQLVEAESHGSRH